MTSYTDEGGCGTRGDDAKVVDLSQCSNGFKLILQKSLDWNDPDVICLLYTSDAADE